MESSPFASFVVINYNGGALLKDCLASLAAQSSTDFDVILVDNGSSVPPDPFFPPALPRAIQVIRNSANRGFAGANNQAIAAARGEWIILVNNDAVLAGDFLAAFRRELPGCPGCRIFTPQVVIQDFKDFIDSAGLGVFLDGIARCRGWQERRELHREPADVFGAAGSVALVHRTVFRDVGLFDEDFFLYLEDLDFALRARRMGYGCRYLPSLVAWHKHSSTTGKHSAAKAYYVERNRIWVAVKNFPVPLLLLSPFYTFFRYLLQGYAAMTHQGITSRFVRSYGWGTLSGILLRAYWDAFRGLPAALKKRKAIKTLAKVSGLTFIRLIFRYRLSWREFAFKD